MPKSLDKLKGTQKRKRTPNSSNANYENDGGEPGTKKKKPQKRSILEGIEMSKQLAKQVQQKRSVRGKSNRSAEPRLCGNGKPMPSLAELEAMYEDSDDDQDPSKPVTDSVTPTDRCATPEQKPIGETNLNSPTALKVMASRVIDLISKKIEVIGDDRPRPPVIPPKRPKKSGIPYIVGCKDRDQVPWAPKTKFCIGDTKYGVEENHSSDEDDECCPKKRKKRGQKMNLSKSIFNAKSDEIAERLKEAENIENIQRKSPDSDGTVDYEFTRRSFSPLPSTSMDSDTINKNHERFMESLQLESLPNESQNEVELIEMPCETIILDNTNSNTSDKRTTDRLSPIDDDCCIIIEPEDSKKSECIKNEDSPEDIYYGSIDLTQSYDNHVYEVGDDDIEIVMAENQAILERERVAKRMDSVTSVDPNVIVLEESTTEANVSVSNPPTADVSISNVQTDNQNSRPNNGIAEVVTNFFRQPEHTDQSLNRANVSGHSVLVGLSQNTLRKIASWISSFSLPKSCPHALRDEVVLIEDSFSTEMPNRSNNTLNASQPKTSQNSRRKEPQPSPQETPGPSVGRSLGDCPICMDSLENTQVASTICGHVFCMACIKAAIQSNRKRCPTCRKVLKGVGYHKLFL